MKYRAQLKADAQERTKAIQEFDTEHPGLTLDDFADLFRFKGDAVSRETIRKALGRNKVQP